MSDDRDRFEGVDSALDEVREALNTVDERLLKLRDRSEE